ncbi:MAG: ATP cone domain-containing protein [Candidatus Aenigmatarchaeota archaeon]
MFVIKADGSKEEFQPNKIIKTCMRAGTTRSMAEEIANKISKRVRNGWTTHKIYNLILSELEKIDHKSSFLFTLRHAITNLGSFNFEIYAKKILESHGYRCEWNKLINGKCVEHQVDIIAKKDKLFLVECKHHINPHRFCGLGILLQVQARLEDIKDGFAENKNKYNFDFAWIFNNTKFSYHAKKYAEAKRIILTGWGYKKEYALENMAHSKKIYPVTILKAAPDIYKKLLDNEIITLQDLITNKDIEKKIRSSDLSNIIKQAENILA